MSDLLERLSSKRICHAECRVETDLSETHITLCLGEERVTFCCPGPVTVVWFAPGAKEPEHQKLGVIPQ